MPVETKRKPYRQELFEVEPKIDFLHEISGFGRFSEVIRNSDGFFLGQVRGDIGYNVWLGEPSINALTRTKRVLEKLSDENKTIAKAILRRFRIFL